MDRDDAASPQDNYKFMKLKKIIIIGILGAILTIPLAVLAAPNIGMDSITPQVAGKAGINTAGVDKYYLSIMVGHYIQVALGFVGLVFLILTSYAGLLWMTAGGNDEQITKAQGLVKEGVIAMIILASAYSITFFMVSAMAQANPDRGLWGNVVDYGMASVNGVSWSLYDAFRGK